MRRFPTAVLLSLILACLAVGVEAGMLLEVARQEVSLLVVAQQVALGQQVGRSEAP